MSSSQFAWPSERTVYLTLDFECDFGTASRQNRYEAVGDVGQLVSLLERVEIPLTCFVQTEVLQERPTTVETLRESDTTVTFHPHSHTHKPRDETSIPREIDESTRRYRDFFGSDPVGYRFPNGNVRDEDYHVLSEHGYEFDASVFPTWRPGHFNNTRARTTPTYRAGHNFFELPFTVYSDWFRIPTALSYCQVLGRPYTWLLTTRPPPVVVLNIHMHDLVTPSTIADLPIQHRLLYSRNGDGLSLLETLVDAFLDQGYSFDTLDSAHLALRSHAPRE
jgi:peptidoglycan/xylan/chitin deacetylase (PgdA/CDA1 family)